MELASLERWTRKLTARIARAGCAAVVLFGVAAFLPAQNPATPKPPPQKLSPLNPSTASSEGDKTAQLSNEQTGDLHMARKEYADAVDYYLRALRDSDQQRAEIWNKIGIAYQQQLDYRHARKAYKRSIQLEKTSPQPWNNLGTSYFLVRKAKKSLKYYREAIKLSPDTATFHLNLGTAYYQMKKIPEALEEYRTALTLNPNILLENARTAAVVQTRTADAKFFFYLAKIFASLGRPDEAIRYLHRAMEEGFQDQQTIANDPDLKKLSKLPAFIELMKHPPVAIK
jgi:tetratricopeptide (TPR) repeat protein